MRAILREAYCRAGDGDDADSRRLVAQKCLAGATAASATSARAALRLRHFSRAT